jgi:hypothetical protein
MALESLPKIAPALFSAEQDLIQIYNKKTDTTGVINASLLGGSTPPSGVSGAIQFSTGSAFGSDSANLFWDNTNKRLGIGTNTPLGILHLKSTAAITRMVIDGDAGFNRLITYRTAGLQRFGLYVNNTAESGSNAGSDFAIRAYNDAGTLLSTPVFIKRSTGNVGIGTNTPSSTVDINSNTLNNAMFSVGPSFATGFQFFNTNNTATPVYGIGLNPSYINTRIGFYDTLTFRANGTQIAEMTSSEVRIGSISGARVGIKGSGSTSATTSLLVQNSGGTQLLKVADDGATTVNVLSTTGITSINNGTFYVGNNFITSYSQSIGFFGPTVASAIVEIQSTTKGFLPPRMTDAQIRAIASPVNGLIAYNTTTDHLCCYQGGAWVKFNHSPM